MDSSSSSAPDSDSDKDGKIFEPNNGKSIMNADLKNTTDRRLLLGIIHRDNDLEPRKMMTQPNASYNNIEMVAVDSRMNISAVGENKDGSNIEDIAALTSPTGGSLVNANRIAPDSGGEHRRDIN